MSDEKTPLIEDVISLTESLKAHALPSRHRVGLVLSGSAHWARDMAARITDSVSSRQSVWISHAAPQQVDAVGYEQATGLLGQERDMVVYDAFSGFDPDAFGAVSGTIKAGGLLILLTPSLDEWPSFADPAAERIAVGECTYKDVTGRYLKRLAHLVIVDEALLLVEEGRACPTFVEADIQAQDTEISLDLLFRSEDQATAVEAIEHVVSGHRRRPAVLISDRGRGKTAALGIAAARLLQQDLKKILVTAPRMGAVEALFERVESMLPDAERHAGRVKYQDQVLEFVPPDELSLAVPSADLVLVDEAAAIPAPLLEQLLHHYSRIVFATTIHGYEGSGRGFAVRFRRTLNEQTPGWREVLLSTPIRWAKDDPLEFFVNRALLLDAAMAEDAAVAHAEAGQCQITRMERDDLMNEEDTLSQLFGLLITAHYRTSPVDLRNLLDGPNLFVYLMRYEGRVVGAALVAEEGGLDDPLATAVMRGERRLRGHLIPQSLALHAQLEAGAKLHGARIMRIAVHPALQGRGFGSKLIGHIRDQMHQRGLDWMGVSFGATVELMQFWQRLGLQAVRIGFSRDHASASHSVMMLAGLSEAGEALCFSARLRFDKYFPSWLSDPLRELDCSYALFLLQGLGSEIRFSQLDLDQVAAFAQGACPYEDSSAPLFSLTLEGLCQKVQSLSGLQRRVLLLKVVQKHSWESVARKLDLKGRKAVLQLLREAAQCLLQQRY
jgi:tRNA(Met) cytidine acetyltransferase